MVLCLSMVLLLLEQVVVLNFPIDGDFDLTLRTGNSTTGSITITDGADGNIDITPMEMVK